MTAQHITIDAWNRRAAPFRDVIFVSLSLSLSSTRDTPNVVVVVVVVVHRLPVVRSLRALTGTSSSRVMSVLETPQLAWLYPPKGHVAGGAVVTITGSGFYKVPTLRCRFAMENEFSVVPGVFVSASEMYCETPTRLGVGTAHVSVTNDGFGYSAAPLVYVKGAGTALKFIFDNSQPGCLDCINSAAPINGFVGLNPNAIREKWTLDNATGPYIGGTDVTIVARALAFPSTPYDLSTTGGVGGNNQLYNQPTGGPGAPHPFNVDPMSTGNGPPITGTFYPGCAHVTSRHLTFYSSFRWCLFRLVMRRCCFASTGD